MFLPEQTVLIAWFHAFGHHIGTDEGGVVLIESRQMEGSISDAYLLWDHCRVSDGDGGMGKTGISPS